jgi:hypothetical protein
MTARHIPRIALCLLLLAPVRAQAQGHGPVYGLSTPTLARSGWSVDVTAMGRLTDRGDMAMLRPMVSYGVTEDFQLSASFPMPLYRGEGLRPARAMTRMPAVSDIELALGWRFHRQGTAVGARFESTAYVGFDYPTEAVSGGIRTSPGVTAALVTGYASRTVYLWSGGLYRRYMSPTGPTADHVGDLAMYSLVVGWRPPMFREDYPNPDWRLFLEAVGEWSAPDESAGADVANTGGHRLFIAPTLLGLYGAWGLAAGPALPVYEDLNGTQPAERVRWVVNVIVWF